MILDLKYYGHPVLRKKCKLIEVIDDKVKKFIQHLIETLLKHDGAGLAASQVGELLSVFVIRYDNGEDSEGRPIFCPPKVYINPILSSPSEKTSLQLEGCLSIPGITEEVERPYKIKVSYLDLEGKQQEEEVTGWRARVIMHENDHLNGVLFIDRLPSKSKKRLENDLRQLKKKYRSLVTKS